MRELIRHLTTTVFVLVATLAGLRIAEACTCGMPTCGNLAKADAVFEATVASIEQSPGLVGTPRAASATFVNGGGMMKVMLKDVKSWRGEAPAVIFTGRGGGDCGYTFRAGERYLIEASRSGDGQFNTGICSTILPIRDADALIAYLQALRETPDQSRVWGTVARVTGWVRFDNALTPVRDAQVTFTGPKGVTVSTDQEGRFLMTDLPRGGYAVTAVVNGKAVPPGRQWSEFRLDTDGGLCKELTIIVPATGGVRGAVVDDQGVAIRNAFIYLLSADHMDRYGDRPGLGLTLPEGTFVLTDVPPGRYLLAMNSGTDPTPNSPYLETETTPFVVVADQTVTAPALRPQRATPIVVGGRVLDPNGAPVSGAQVYYWIQLSNGRRGGGPRLKTDTEGRFSGQLWKDQRYVITVGPEDEPWGRIEFVADGQPVTITARLR